MDNQDTQKTSYKIFTSKDLAPGVIDPRHLVVPQIPANGDMFYSDGTRFVKLGAGTNGQTLINRNGVPLWSTTTGVSGATGTTASLGPSGALAGGPATATQKGWAVVYVAGVKCYFPIWV